MKNLVKFVVFLAIVFIGANCFAMAGIEMKNLKGQTAPSFSLQDLNDKVVSSGDFFGKQPVLLFFWITTCPHCWTEMKKLNDISSSLEQKGAKIITIDLGESKSRVSSYVKEGDYNLIVLLDRDETLVSPYGLVGVPTFFLIGKNGKVKFLTHSLPEDYEKILFQD